MSRKRSFLIKAFLVAFVTLASACSLAAGTANNLSSKIILVGSIPGDSPVKSMLAIDSDKKIDFIRWDLTLNKAESGSKTYVLNASFREGVPNTRDFKNGGEKITREGSFTVSKKQLAEIYELKNEKEATVVTLIKLNENLFHLLTADNKLMVENVLFFLDKKNRLITGDGEFSFTLNRRNIEKSVSSNIDTHLINVQSEKAE